jgi:hypothetical protein
LDHLDLLRFGTFFPLRRASERPIAIACLRLFTFLPLLPLLSVPRLRLRIAPATSFDAVREYFLGIIISSLRDPAPVLVRGVSSEQKISDCWNS